MVRRIGSLFISRRAARFYPLRLKSSNARPAD
jgi:hypothetical protein